MAKSPLAQGRRYGHKPDRVGDPHVYLALTPPAVLPSVFSLRPGFGPVYDQGQTSSCTGNATAAVLQYMRKEEGKTPDFTPSRLFLYFNGRDAEGNANADDGATIANVVDGAANLGFPTEATWPFDPARITTRPTDGAYTEAKSHASPGRAKLFQNEHALKAALFAGTPVIFGIVAYEGLESQATATSGILHVPKSSERIVGGHAIVLVGWDDKRGLWEWRNSWSAAWGDHGYAWADKAYFLDQRLASDFTIFKEAA